MNDKKKSSYKDRLLQLKAELVGDIGKTIKTSKEEESTQHIPDDADSASQSYDRQLLLKLGEQGWEKLKLVEEALRKLGSNDFGVCDQCEKSIPEARLDLVPFTQYCVGCLNQIEINNKVETDVNGK